MGYLPEGHRFPGYLTARQTLSIFGRMSGVAPRALAPRIEDLLSRVKLSDWIDVKVKKFSKGMTQRLGLAAALVHEPEVLLLDEPTDGVDPVGRREIRDLLKAEAAKGRAILLNSHLLSEIELTCDRVAVLRNGKVAAMGTIEELTKREEKKDSLKGYKLVASPLSEELVLADFVERGASPERVNGHVPRPGARRTAPQCPHRRRPRPRRAADGADAGEEHFGRRVRRPRPRHAGEGGVDRPMSVFGVPFPSSPSKKIFNRRLPRRAAGG